MMLGYCQPFPFISGPETEMGTGNSLEISQQRRLMGLPRGFDFGAPPVKVGTIQFRLRMPVCVGLSAKDRVDKAKVLGEFLHDQAHEAKEVADLSSGY